MGPEQGTYALLLEAPRRATVMVGRLGRLDVVSGCYLYVGSALGAGGLAARLGRHMAGRGRWRWHVDYLRQATRPIGAWLTTGPVRLEHRWAAAAAAMAGSSLPRPGFGASDCDCPAHLFHFPRRPTVSAFRRALEAVDGAPAEPIEEVCP